MEAKIILGVVTSFITGTYPGSEVAKACSYFRTGFMHSKAYKEGRWDGRTTLFNKSTGSFPTGLLSNVIDVLCKYDIKFRVMQDFEWPAPYKEFSAWSLSDKVIPRDRHLEAIEAITKQRRGQLELPTRMGKTSVIAPGVIATFKVPTLFIAHQLDLVYDAKATFEKHLSGVGTVGLIGGGVRDIQPITCACIDSLANTVNEEYMMRYLKNYVQLVMVDEGQNFGPGEYKKVLNTCNAPYRVTFSATMFRDDGASMEIQGAFGKMAYKISESDMINEGYISDVNISMVPFDHELYNERDKDLNYAEFYNDNITHNERRNALIIEEAKKMLADNRYILIIVSRIDHGHILKQMFIDNGIEDVEFIYGDTDAKERVATREDYNSGKFRVLIGSTIFDVGINVPIASGIILAGAGDSKTRAPQRVGRVLCAVENKTAVAVDIADQNVAFFARQAKSRQRTYVERFGDSRVHVPKVIRVKSQEELELEQMFPSLPNFLDKI